MTTPDWFIDAAISIVGGAVLLGLRVMLASRDKQGERLGRLEQWIDRENGRREGRAEALREIGRSGDGK